MIRDQPTPPPQLPIEQGFRSAKLLLSASAQPAQKPVTQIHRLAHEPPRVRREPCRIALVTYTFTYKLTLPFDTCFVILSALTATCNEECLPLESSTAPSMNSLYGLPFLPLQPCGGVKKFTQDAKSDRCHRIKALDERGFKVG